MADLVASLLLSARALALFIAARLYQALSQIMINSIVPVDFVHETSVPFRQKKKPTHPQTRRTVGILQIR